MYCKIVIIITIIISLLIIIIVTIMIIIIIIIIIIVIIIAFNRLFQQVARQSWTVDRYYIVMEWMKSLGQII